MHFTLRCEYGKLKPSTKPYNCEHYCDAFALLVPPESTFPTMTLPLHILQTTDFVTMQFVSFH